MKSSDEKKSKSIIGVLCVLFAGICWGTSGAVSQYLFMTKDIDNQWLTIVRMVFAGIVLLTISVIRNPASVKAVWTKRNDAIRLVAFATCGFVTSQYSYFTALYYSNSGTATILQYLGQGFILIYVCVRAWRLPTKKEGVAVLLALIGVFLLVTHGNIHTLVLSKEALFWGLAAALGFMLYTVIPGNLLDKYGAPVCTGYGMLIGGSVLFLVTGGWNLTVSLDATLIACVSFIVVIGTALPFSLYMHGVKEIGGVKASLLACTEPVMATLLSAIWLNTHFAVLDIVAFALIILMVMLLAIPENQTSRIKK